MSHCEPLPPAPPTPMRPQKLSLKNFMPFRVTGNHSHEVDFSQLDLFSITGPLGSGKSALIDAIVWCLYGRTARYSTDSKGVISAGEQTCEVALDFSVGERWFRAIRRTGKTTESGLSERDGEEWIKDQSGSAPLTKRIEELLGLDFDSFTKTVILPQGRYAEFLTSEPKKRRDLLAKILELGVYERVADQARLVANKAKIRTATLRETLAQYAGLSQERMTLQREELAKLVHHIDQAAQQEKLLQRVAQQVDQVAELRGRVAELQTEVQSRNQERETAQKKKAEASAQLAGLTQEFGQISQEREALGYDAARHEVVKRAVAHLSDWAVAQREAEQKNAEHTRVQAEVEALAQQIAAHTRHVEQARSKHQTHTAVLTQLVAEAGDVATLTEKLAAAKRWKELQQEQQNLAPQLDSLRQKQSATQHALDNLERQEAIHGRAVRELQDKLERAKEDEQQKRQLTDEAERLSRAMQEAAEAEKRVQAERESTRTALIKAEHAARHVQQALTQAEAHERAARAALEDSQRQHEAAHLREALHVGDACPVCRAIVSEIPPAQEAGDDLKKLQAHIARAQQTTAQKRTEAQEANAAIAARQAEREATERELKERGRVRQAVQERFGSHFPSSTSPAEALSALGAQQKALSATLTDLEDRRVSAEQEKEELLRQREAAQREAVRLDEALRGTTKELDTAKRRWEECGGEIAAFLTPHEDPEQIVAQRRTRVVRAEQQMKESEKTLRQAETALSKLDTARVQKEGSLTLLDSERAGALRRAEREAQAVRECLGLPQDAALPQAGEVARELNALSDKQTQHTDLSRREEKVQAKQKQAERQAAESQADFFVRTQVLKESQEKHRQAHSRLEKERAKLQGAIVQHTLTDAGEDGEHIKPRLETVRGQMLSLQEHRGRLEAEQAEAEQRWKEKEREEERLDATETEERLASDLRGLLGSQFIDFLSRGAIEALMHDASGHLQRLTHGRYTFDIAYRGRAINLQIVDHENQRLARPTHSLSGGETFLASLAIALALSQGFRTVATGRAARTSTECLILDEGFGTLDREGVQLVTETLQELRGEEDRMVGIITHVEEVAAAMPARVEIHKGNRSSTISVLS